MILTSLLQLPAPLLTKYLIDTIVPAKNIAKLNLFALLLVGILLISKLFAFTQNHLLITYRNKVESDIRSLLFKKLMEVRLEYLERNRKGYIESRIDTDVTAVGSLFLETVLNLLIDFLTFLAGVSICFYLNMNLAIVSVLSLPVFIISFHIFSRKMNTLTADRQEKWAGMRGSTVEFIAQAKIIKAFNSASQIFYFYSMHLKKAIAAKRKLEIFNVLSSIAVGLTGALLPLFVLWFGIREIIEGNFTLGGFIAFNTCIGYLYNPMKNFINLNIDVHAALAAAERIFQIMDYPEETSTFGTKKLEKIDSIDIKNVTFFFDPEEKRGVENISFSLKGGDKVAVVGMTGKGKSTIARLLMGFDIPHSGDIELNREKYTIFNLESIRKRIAYVPQEPGLFAGPIIQNLVFLEKKYDKSMVNKSIKWCALEETLERFPNGLDTIVFESGTGLSGGEKQRLAIARALIRKPDVLILDEATSALDPETEKELIAHLFTLPWNPAILMITHRYNYLEQFDQVINLDSRGGLAPRRSQI